MTLALGQMPQIDILCKWANLHTRHLLREPCQTTIHSCSLSFPWRLLQFLGYDTKIFLLTVPCPLLLTVNVLRAGSSCWLPASGIENRLCTWHMGPVSGSSCPPPSLASSAGLDCWASQGGLFRCTAFLESNSAMKSIKSSFAFWSRISLSGISPSGEVCIWSL